MKQFRAPGSETASIPSKTLRESGEEEAGDIKGQPGAKNGGKGAEGEET